MALHVISLMLASRSARLAACLAACLAFVPRAAQAGALRAGVVASYLDGTAPRRVTRLGRLDKDGRAELTLAHPRTGEALRATVGNEALVQLAADADPSTLSEAGMSVVRLVSPQLRIYQVRGHASEDGLDLAERLTKQPHAAVRAIIPDLAFPMIRASSAFSPPPNDPRLTDQWFWDRLGMNAAWARETGSASTTVVVIDDGCDLQHPDLKDKLDPGTDVLSMDSDPSYLPNSNGNNHGTSCAGLVGASTNNGLGVSGACPGCRLRCVRFLGADGDLTPIGADIAAFQFALDVNAAVVSNSWGFKQAVPVPDMVRQIVEKLYDTGRGGKGALVVFAAGNDDRALGNDEINNVRGVITVGATNNFDELTSYSNYGPSVAIVAPTGTLTTDISGSDGADPGDYVSSFSGTSSACPIVAGVLGLMVSAAPDRSAAEITSALLDSARQSMFATPDASGHDDYYGRGGIRPLDALRLLGGEVLDGGVVFDAGVDAGMPQKERGCGCALGARAPTMTGAWLLVISCSLLLRRRRRLRVQRCRAG